MVGELTEDHWTKALECEGYGRQMARGFARQFHQLNLDVEDLYQATLMALALAARDHKSDLGTFNTFAHRRVWAGLISEGKRQAPHYAWDRERESFSLDSTDIDPIDGEVPLTSTPSAEEAALPGLMAEELWSLVDRLPERERDFIQRAFGPLAESQTSIGATSSPPLSQQRVQQIIRHGLDTLKAMLTQGVAA